MTIEGLGYRRQRARDLIGTRQMRLASDRRRSQRLVAYPEATPLGAPQSRLELLRERNRGKFIRMAPPSAFHQPALDKAPLSALKVQGFRVFY